MKSTKLFSLLDISIEQILFQEFQLYCVETELLETFVDLCTKTFKKKNQKKTL